MASKLPCIFCRGPTRVGNQWRNSEGVVRKYQCLKCKEKFTCRTREVTRYAVAILKDNNEFAEYPEGTLLLLTKPSVAERMKTDLRIDGEIVKVRVTYITENCIQEKADKK